MMNKTIIEPGVILLEFPTQYEVAATFMRLQEFYESPLPEIRRRYFSLEFIMDRYAAKFGNFTYFSDWTGFNVPGHIVRSFFDAGFRFDAQVKEIALYNELVSHIVGIESFYVIGAVKNDGATIDHEIAHARWYLDKDYRFDMSSLLANSMPNEAYIRMRDELIDMGYDHQFIPDEIHAYLSTSSADDLDELFDDGKGWGARLHDATSLFRLRFEQSNQERRKVA